jgi:hypothetical protein
MVKRALKKGIQPRVEANDLEEAKKFMDMGVRHMCIGTDLGTIGDGVNSRPRAASPVCSNHCNLPIFVINNKQQIN